MEVSTRVATQSTPAQCCATEAQPDTLELEAQQKRIFDKVWNSVEKVMGAMREDLLTKLKEVGRPVEEQEAILECAAKVIWICY